MSPTSLLPALACFGTAFIAAQVLLWREGTHPVPGRNASIDGLRGYLAFFVFLHHACIWYYWLHTGKWQSPPSHLYTHFGQSSVALFFMITGFLFFGKLLDHRRRKVDWLHLYVSRCTRLVPLYALAMLALFVVVVVLSRGILQEDFPTLLRHCLQWAAFTIVGAPDVNRVQQTSQIVAAVSWSLPYEWFFYCALPLLAIGVSLRQMPPVSALVFGVAIALWIFFDLPRLTPLAPFAGGIFAAWVSRAQRPRQWLASRLAAILALVCLAGTVIFFDDAQGVLAVVLLSIAFTIIACGNDLFGALSWPVSRFFGEQAYSLYLLHGLVLFVLFRFVLHYEFARTLSPVSYWIVIVCTTPLLVCLCHASFRHVEAPGMDLTDPIVHRIRVTLAHRS